MNNDQEDQVDYVNDVAQQAAAEAGSTERTVAFFADPRAATLLLTETVSRLIDALGIERGLVDLSSLPGLAIAAAFEREKVPYDSLTFGQTDNFIEWMPDRDELHNPVIGADAERFRTLAAGVTDVPFAELGNIDANVVLIPSMVGDDEKYIDFSPGTLPGAVLAQLEAVERPVVIIDTPERGLRHSFEGRYQRAIIHVAAPDQVR